jgi:hypothetical protein
MNFELCWRPDATAVFEELEQAARRAAETRVAKTSKSGKNKASKQEGLFKQVAKAVQLLATDPRHPGLNTHPFESLEHPYETNGKVFEAYAQNKTPGAYRIFWCYGPEKNQITIIAITPHP